MENNRKILITGISGFIGSHTAIQLLEKEHRVLGTLRDMGRATQVREIIAAHTKNVEQLSLAQAELLDETSWQRLMEGIDWCNLDTFS